jgi:hypothetical protein
MVDDATPLPKSGQTAYVVDIPLAASNRMNARKVKLADRQKIVPIDLPVRFGLSGHQTA